ncbi:type 4a pilus biogenesis protein PilO [Bacillus sp. N9]
MLSIYLAFLQPLSSELQSKKNTKVILEGDIAVLEAKSEKALQNSREDSQLLSKIPLHPELESLLLSIHSIETTSGNRISNVEFKYDRNEIEGVEENGESSDSNNMSKPNGLRSITAELSVQSPNYGQFMSFLNEVEKLERITSVDQLEFINSSRESSADIIEYTIVITTYYFGK